MIQGHILKFLSKDESKVKEGKICMPSQTYGHSIQSPDWFKRKFSLPAKGGYQYKFDDPQFKEKFNYASQKNQLKVVNLDSKILNGESQKKNCINNRKKGLLSSFLDKNSWIKTVIPLTGVERSEEARKINNLQRDKNIQTIRLKKSAYIASKTMSNFYSTNRSGRFSQRKRQIYTSENGRNHQNMNNPQLLKFNIANTLINQKINASPRQYLIGQRQRIKSARNQLAMNKIHSIEKIKIDQQSNSKKLKNIDKDFIKNMMTVTARQWGQGKNISPSKTIQRFQQMISENNSIELSRKTNRSFFNKKVNNLIKEENNYNILSNKKYSLQL